MKGAKWYAAGGGVLRRGPFRNQQVAWEAMRLADPPPGGSPYPPDARVWPEWVRKVTGK